jgi:hypothetical protein
MGFLYLILTPLSMKKLILVSMLFALSLSCEDDKGDCPASDRTGAMCKDGTSSTATGSGACSNHGGVDYWKCK